MLKTISLIATREKVKDCKTCAVVGIRGQIFFLQSNIRAELTIILIKGLECPCAIQVLLFLVSHIEK